MAHDDATFLDFMTITQESTIRDIMREMQAEGVAIGKIYEMRLADIIAFVIDCRKQDGGERHQ